MKLLYVADGRSPIARSWIRYFVEAGHEVHLASTRPMPALPGLRSSTVIPVAFSGLAGPAEHNGGGAGMGGEQAVGLKQPSVGPAQPSEAAADAGEPAGPEQRASGSFWRSASTMHLRTWLRHWIGPLTVARAGRRLGRLIDDLRPDLVHGLRIPFEGAMAAAAGGGAPRIVSSWGNDFTLHAPASPWMRRMTHRTLRRADGLHTDCRRDLRLAAEWGYDPARASVVLPGNGGVRREIFHAGPPGEPAAATLAETLRSIPVDAPVVLNPRGFRAYVRSDTFFRAVPLILERHPSAQFLCPAMAGERRAERWVERLGLHAAVHLLPTLSPADMAVVMRRALVMVSSSEHDGTPNTLLEAMACGAYPVLGALESVAEWIDHGRNGELVDPAQPRQLAEAVSAALADSRLRARAAEINQGLIAERAEYAACMARAERFYRRVLGG